MNTTVENQPTNENMLDQQQRTKLLEAQAERYVELQATIKHLTQQLDQLKTQLLNQLPEGTHRAGEHTITIKNGNRGINTTSFMQAYPPADHPHLYELKPLAFSKLIEQEGLQNLEPYVTHGKTQVKVQ